MNVLLLRRIRMEGKVFPWGSVLLLNVGCIKRFIVAL